MECFPCSTVWLTMIDEPKDYLHSATDAFKSSRNSSLAINNGSRCTWDFHAGADCGRRNETTIFLVCVRGNWIAQFISISMICCYARCSIRSNEKVQINCCRCRCRNGCREKERSTTSTLCGASDVSLHCIWNCVKNERTYLWCWGYVRNRHRLRWFQHSHDDLQYQILASQCLIRSENYSLQIDGIPIEMKSGFLRHRVERKKYLILLSVRIRIHCGMEQFCLSFLPNLRLILNVLWAAYGKNRMFSNQLNVNIALASQIICKSYFLFRKKIRGAHTMSSEYPRVKKLTETFWQCVRVHIESD